MRSGKISKSVYIYLVDPKKWPKSVATVELLALKGVMMDKDIKSGMPLGYEFLDVYGVEVDGRKV